MEMKDTCSLKSDDKHRRSIKKQRLHFAGKDRYKSYGFSSSHVWMWELWALKNLCFWIVVLENTLKSPLDCKEITPVNPKGNQPWIFTGRTDDEAEAPVLWPADAKSWLVGKDPHARKDWRQKEKGAQSMRWLDRCSWIWKTPTREWRTGKPGVLQSMGLQSWIWLSNWKTTIIPQFYSTFIFNYILYALLKKF